MAPMETIPISATMTAYSMEAAPEASARRLRQERWVAILEEMFLADGTIFGTPKTKKEDHDPVRPKPIPAPYCQA